MNDIDDDESNSHSKRGEYAWALNIYKQLSKNFGAFETVAATSTKPLVFKYINHGGRRNEEKRPWKGADEQIAQVGDHVDAVFLQQFAKTTCRGVCSWSII